MLCKNCRTQANTGQKFCTECGLALDINKNNEAKPNLPVKNKDSASRAQPLSVKGKETSDPEGVMPKWAVWVFVVFAFCIVVAFAVAENNMNNPSAESQAPAKTAPARPKPTPEPAPWFPKNYTQLSDDVAYKKIKNSDCDISIAHSCFQMYVVTNKSCNLFISANFLVNDVVIDYTLDSVTVTSGQRAIMTFASIDAASYEGSGQIEFTDVTCY